MFSPEIRWIETVLLVTRFLAAFETPFHAVFARPIPVKTGTAARHLGKNPKRSCFLDAKYLASSRPFSSSNSTRAFATFTSLLIPKTDLKDFDFFLFCSVTLLCNRTVCFIAWKLKGNEYWQSVNLIWKISFLQCVDFICKIIRFILIDGVEHSWAFGGDLISFWKNSIHVSTLIGGC